MNIISNNIEREILNFCQLPDNVKSDFDYIDDPDNSGAMFAKYKGHYYDLGEFTRAPDSLELLGWQGINTESYFSGVLIRFTDDNEAIIMGRYYS